MVSQSRKMSMTFLYTNKDLPLPNLFFLDARIDNELRPRIALGRSIMMFPNLFVIGYYEIQIVLGIVHDLPVDKEFTSETVWSA